MNNEEGFLQTILAEPDTDVPRLVYADWLEEHGNPRSDYLRTELALAKLRTGSRKAPALRERLLELRTQIDSGWLAIFDQPALLRANPTPFPTAWWSVDLEGYRSCDSTYGGYRYEAQPPLPVEQFHGDFRWLSQSRKRGGPAGGGPWDRIGQVEGNARQLDLPLPSAFVKFMGSLALQKEVRSCTDCYFNLPAKIVPSPKGEGGYLLRFYSDSQGCLHWYLYLHGTGYHCVVLGDYYGGSPEWPDASEEENDEKEVSRGDEIRFCAPSFEAFLYRYWLENEIWYAVSWPEERRPLTAEEQAYVNHFKAPRVKRRKKRT